MYMTFVHLHTYTYTCTYTYMYTCTHTYTYTKTYTYTYTYTCTHIYIYIHKMNYHLRMLYLSMLRFKKEWYIHFPNQVNIWESTIHSKINEMLWDSSKTFCTKTTHSVLLLISSGRHYKHKDEVTLWNEMRLYLYTQTIIPPSNHFFISLKEKKEGTDK